MALLYMTFFASRSAAQKMVVTAPSPLTCGNPSDAVPLYWSTIPSVDVFYTTAITDITSVIRSDGYDFGGITCLVFTTQELSTVPLFHVYNGNDIDNFYTTSTTERDLALESGYTASPIAAYIYPSQICGSIPLYCIYTSIDTAHIYTTNVTERDAILALGGWTDEGITGYVLDYQSTCA
ncbi:hypothetical protein B0H16DRAFT_1731690 [Mycena metata]|uniref:DUF5648 domain-containing protein n=1 Tax=Mycena metata TaxID=1033252 RepID=A0AAD7I3Z6_9AGAR|nr:hypothetical protein B0H16DRAFT_1731690 [Mycena metata]